MIPSSSLRTVHRLGLLLRKVEGSPLLLVIDDVWPDSESLIEKFQYQISDYKILVTSRVAFPTLGTTFILKPFGHSLLDSNPKILDVLEDNPITKECFMDLALFPEDQKIPVAALIDIWAELFGLDDDGIEAMDIINKLESMNLANLLITRKDASDTDNCCYNNHFIILHDLLRGIGIYQSTMEPIKKRKRLIIDTNDQKHGSWLAEKHAEKQQSMMAVLLSKYITCCVKQNPQHVPARTLSISTDESCASDWSQMESAKTEVLLLNIRTKEFFFPESMKKMTKLKVLLVKNHGFHPSQLKNLELLGSLSNLKRIRLERISVHSFGLLKNLRKLSLYMCNSRQTLEKGSILI